MKDVLSKLYEVRSSKYAVLSSETEVELTRVICRTTLSADLHSCFNCRRNTNMSCNPCEHQTQNSCGPSVLSESRKDLVKVAKYQRTIFLVIFAWMLAVACEFWLPRSLSLVAEGCVIVMGIVAAVLITLFAKTAYGLTPGITLGGISLGFILYQVPILAFLILLMMNWKATALLKSNGIKVC